MKYAAPVAEFVKVEALQNILRSSTCIAEGCPNFNELPEDCEWNS